jgi:hypothetical protein
MRNAEPAEQATRVLALGEAQPSLGKGCEKPMKPAKLAAESTPQMSSVEIDIMRLQ